MALTHGGITQLSNEGQELEPFLDFLEDTNVGVATLVHLHVFQSLLKLLDLVFHISWLQVFPSRSLVQLKDTLAVGYVVPKRTHVVDLKLNQLDLPQGIVNEVGVAELASNVAKISNLVLKNGNLGEDGIELNFGLILSAFVLVELTLLHLLLEVLLVILEFVDIVVVLASFLGNKRVDLLLHVLG